MPKKTVSNRYSIFELVPPNLISQLVLATFASQPKPCSLHYVSQTCHAAVENFTRKGRKLKEKDIVDWVDKYRILGRRKQFFCLSTILIIMDEPQSCEHSTQRLDRGLVTICLFFSLNVAIVWYLR